MENPINMDDLGVPPFKETPIWLLQDSNNLYNSGNIHLSSLVI